MLRFEQLYTMESVLHSARMSMKEILAGSPDATLDDERARGVVRELQTVCSHLLVGPEVLGHEASMIAYKAFTSMMRAHPRSKAHAAKAVNTLAAMDGYIHDEIFEGRYL